jgi:hypothetical protein
VPYSIRKAGSGYAVVKKDSGKTVAKHTSKAKAQAQIRAIYANEAKKK